MLFVVIFLLTLLVVPSHADRVYKVWSPPAGSAHYTLLTGLIKAAQSAHPELKYELSAGKPGTRITLEVAKGNVDFGFMVSDIVVWLREGKLMFKPLKNHAELAANLRVAFMYRGGYLQPFAWADSGIKTLSDLKGKKVCIGPKTAALNRIMRDLIFKATGLKGDIDYKVVPLDWRSSAQAFQDREVDFTILSDHIPAATAQQWTLTSKVRIIGITDEEFKRPGVKEILTVYGRTVEFIPPDIYGKNQTNEVPSRAMGFWAGVGVNKDVPEDVVYKSVKAFWENMGNMRKAVAWAEAIKLEEVFKSIDLPLHPGAEKYFKEVGLKTPK